jgi:hypothetical protein
MFFTSQLRPSTPSPTLHSDCKHPEHDALLNGYNPSQHPTAAPRLPHHSRCKQRLTHSAHATNCAINARTLAAAHQ